LEAIDRKVKVTNDPDINSKAKTIILPGVGAFGRGMENLRKLGLIPLIYEAVEEKKSIRGICLRLQSLFTESGEHGVYKGMGWNQIKFKDEDSKILQEIPDNSYFYFVHSYYVEPEDNKIIVTTTEYGQVFSSVINKDNVFGVQFHPEKSAELGLKFLENFCHYVS